MRSLLSTSLSRAQAPRATASMAVETVLRCRAGLPTIGMRALYCHIRA